MGNALTNQSAHQPEWKGNKGRDGDCRGHEKQGPRGPQETPPFFFLPVFN